MLLAVSRYSNMPNNNASILALITSSHIVYITTNRVRDNSLNNISKLENRRPQLANY